MSKLLSWIEQEPRGIPVSQATNTSLEIYVIYHLFTLLFEDLYEESLLYSIIPQEKQ